MKPKLIFFDCDGVLINQSTWAKMLKLIKFPEGENMRLWKKYYDGEITFRYWIDIQSEYFRKNMTKKLYHEEIVNKVEFNPEAKKIVDYIKSKKIPIAIVSSGEFDYVKAVAVKLGIKTVKVNTFFRYDSKGRFTKMDFYTDDPVAKIDQVKEVCKVYGCKPEETFFVGDSDNDLGAFDLTKHGILYRTKKDKLIKRAWKTINNLYEIKNLVD